MTHNRGIDDSKTESECNNEDLRVQGLGAMSFSTPSEEVSRPSIDSKTDPARCYSDWEFGVGVPENSEDFQRPVIKSRCNTCTDLFDHSVRLQNLKWSAMDGCDMCSAIVTSVHTVASHVPGISNNDVKISQWLSESGLRVVVEHPSVSKGAAINIFSSLERPCPWAPSYHLPKIHASTDSVETFSKIKAWLAKCQSQHSHCQAYDSPVLPTRVVDVGIDIEETDGVRLIQTHGKKAIYVTLSYCWGGIDFIKTTTNNREQNFHDINFNTLPRTFQDAVIICRRLRIQFLWIDSLCIFQDDKEDMTRELGQMCSIFEHSHFTIAASSAQNPLEGCFHVADPDYHTHQLDVQGSKERYRVYCRRDLHTSPSLGRESPVSLHILTRGWVHQERILSRRILYFEKNELLWECNEESWCECSYPATNYLYLEREPKSQITQTLNQMEVDLITLWPALVREYSRCALTNKSDVLPALSGIAEYVQRHRPGSKYVAGFWSNHLILYLFWYNLRTSSQRASPWRAPTWSWASVVNGDFIFGSAGKRDLYVWFKINSWECVPVSQANKTGELKSAVLHLSGYLWQTELERSATPFPDLRSQMPKMVMYLSATQSCEAQGQRFIVHGIDDVYAIIHLDVELPVDSFPIDSRKTIWLLRGCEWEDSGWDPKPNAGALLLIQGREAGTFERIGMLWQYEPRSEDFWGEMVDICLV